MVCVEYIDEELIQVPLTEVIVCARMNPNGANDPAHYTEEIKSTGEKQFFDLLRHDPATVDWVCLHSLSLARHVKRVYGEIDFVVLIPKEGIFCLEIKSGRVARQGGIWNYTNRYGDVSTSTIGPFRQARDGCFPCLRLSENTLVGNTVLPDFSMVLVSCSRISFLLKTIQRLNIGRYMTGILAANQ